MPKSQLFQSAKTLTCPELDELAKRLGWSLEESGSIVGYSTLFLASGRFRPITCLPGIAPTVLRMDATLPWSQEAARRAFCSALDLQDPFVKWGVLILETEFSAWVPYVGASLRMGLKLVARSTGNKLELNLHKLPVALQSVAGLAHWISPHLKAAGFPVEITAIDARHTQGLECKCYDAGFRLQLAAVSSETVESFLNVLERIEANSFEGLVVHEGMVDEAVTEEHGLEVYKAFVNLGLDTQKYSIHLNYRLLGWEGLDSLKALCNTPDEVWHTLGKLRTPSKKTVWFFSRTKEEGHRLIVELKPPVEEAQFRELEEQVGVEFERTPCPPPRQLGVF